MTFTGTTARGQMSAEDFSKISADVAAELREVVGSRFVSNDPAVLDTYAWQYVAEAVSGENYILRPLAVVLPKDTGEVAEVVKLCNRLGVKYKATSTGFGAWNGSGKDHIVQIDLRRLDRIHEIDKDNMYAVIDPYVTGNQLQTEAFKVGLNTHIAGVGAQASVLASATSMMGQGWDGVSMGFSDRNLLGVEWVTPDGEVVRVGSFGAAGEYFAGDGPGFSLRGAFRGFGGALGGLGVFTRAAVKLYPFTGPKQLKHEGISPVHITEVPENHLAAMVLVNDWKDMAELGRRLGEAEICDGLGRNAPALMSAVITVDNNELKKVYAMPLMHEIYYALIVLMFAEDKEELNYRKKALKKIVRDLNGGMLMSGLGPEGAYWMMRLIRTLTRRVGTWTMAKGLPGFIKMVMKDVLRYGIRKGPNFLASTMYQSFLRSNMNMRGVFRFGGSFWTAMGALTSWDNAIHGAKVGAKVKQKYIDKKIIFDDGADNAWGGLYEGGAYAHLEELCCYDQTDPYCRERVLDYILETNVLCIQNICGDSLNAIGPPNHALYSPQCYNYDKWQRAIKSTLDPEDISDGSFYTDPEFEKNPPEFQAKVFARVMNDVMKIDSVD
jgi:hypothetical protein